MDFNPPSPYVISGIQAGWTPGDPNGPRPLRRNVDEWYTSTAQVDQDQVYLFIQALSFWEAVDNNKKLSFFQVTGVHGLPLVPWDENTKSQTPGQGYCTHFSVLFPTWHRPYVLLYEQVIYQVMKQEIIPNGQWDNATIARLNLAADTWRLPFWDWATRSPNDSSGTYMVPKIAYGPTITVVNPNGQSETPQNPVYKFSPGGTFSSFDVDDQTFGISEATSRWSPSDSDADFINGHVDNSLVVNAMDKPSPTDWPANIPTLADSVYRLFTAKYVSKYAAFATAAWTQQQPNDYTSLENIHGNIHGYTGGFAQPDGTPFFGHMANVPVAAFDPIFWFHHCNVDRILAIWTTLFPKSQDKDYWFDNPDQELSEPGTWAIPPNTVDTPTIPLAPFHKDQSGSNFTSDDVYTWSQLGYAYPELQPWDPSNQVNGQLNSEKYLANIRVAITNLYDHSTPMFLAKPAPSLLEATSIPQAAQAVQALVSGPSKQATHDDYIVNVKYDRFHFGGRPFIINIFFDQVKVGDVYNFSAPPESIGRGPQGCENCNRQILEGTLATGQVPITRAIWKSPNVNELNEDEVKAYLTQHLRWTVVKNNGEQVPDADLHFLEVSVAQGKGTHYQEDQTLSRFSDYEVLHAITQGKAGGLQQGGS